MGDFSHENIYDCPNKLGEQIYPTTGMDHHLYMILFYVQTDSMIFPKNQTIFITAVTFIFFFEMENYGVCLTDLAKLWGALRIEKPAIWTMSGPAIWSGD